MNTLYQILGIMAAGMLIWLLWRTIKGRPELFSKSVINESFRFMGYLALVLIAFVIFLVFLARST